MLAEQRDPHNLLEVAIVQSIGDNGKSFKMSRS